MPKEFIQNGNAIGPYSSAVVVGNQCFVAGTGGFIPGTSQLIDGGIAAEVNQTMKNLEATIIEAGFTLADVVFTTCYLRDIAHWPLLNEVYGSYFVDRPPARAAVVVGEMPGGANLEITCIAVREP